MATGTDIHFLFTYGTLKYERHGYPAEARG
jgi:hypothetical protein